MAKIPETDAGLSEDLAVEAGTILRRGFDVLRSLQFNKKASVLRYTETGGKEHLGIPPTKTLVSGLSDLSCAVYQISIREVMASHGVIEMNDMLFIIYAEVLETDQILYNTKTYKVIQLKYYDPDIGRSQVVARMI